MHTVSAAEELVNLVIKSIGNALSNFSHHLFVKRVKKFGEKKE